MSFSASQLIAISGFYQNLGLQVSQDLLDRITDVHSTDILSGKIRRVVTNANASAPVKTVVRVQIPGIGLSAPSSYTILPTGFTANNITGSLLTFAQSFFANGVRGYIGILGSATNSCRNARDVLGSLYALEREGFVGVAPDVSNHLDLSTGGITSKFGPLAVGSQDYLRASGLYSGQNTITTQSVDIKRSIVAVAEAISGLGTLYDFQSLESFGTAYGLVTNLLAQGLVKAEFITSFTEEQVDLEALDRASDAVLTSILEQITGSELLRIISNTGLQVPSNAIIRNAADFLSTEKVIGLSAINAIPGGTLKNLAKQLISLNVKYEVKDDLVIALKDIEILDTPLLAQLTDPVPDADTTIIRLAFPSGSGDFGSPYIQEVIGTPSGYVHVDSLIVIYRVVLSLASTTEAQALASAADALFAKYNANLSATAEETAFITAVNNLYNIEAYSNLLAETNGAISDIIDQITLEQQNQTRAGIDLTLVLPGTASIGQLCAILPTIGFDAFNSGATPMLLDMLTNDIYGQATRAVLLQGSNEQILKTIGKETIGISDIEKVALGVRALAGEGLTPQQRENVIEDARARNLDINNALANAVFYGYNNQYFVSRGFPSA
jgi:hypothetical protein